eukprot:1717910-Pyramimonas_sp.AAC.1
MAWSGLLPRGLRRPKPPSVGSPTDHLPERAGRISSSGLKCDGYGQNSGAGLRSEFGGLVVSLNVS